MSWGRKRETKAEAKDRGLDLSEALIFVEKCKDLQEKKENLKKQNEKVEETISEKKEELKKLIGEIKSKRKKIKSKNEKIEELDDKLNSLKKLIELQTRPSIRRAADSKPQRESFRTPR